LIVMTATPSANSVDTLLTGSFSIPTRFLFVESCLQSTSRGRR
jgi:hypothetical protein